MKNKIITAEINKKISNIIILFLGILLILLPFNAFINSFFVYKLDFGLVKYWKELIVGMILLLSSINLLDLKDVKEKIPKWIIVFGSLFLVILMINFISIGLSGASLIALRLDGLIVAMVFVGFWLSQVMDDCQKELLVRIFLGATFVSLILGLIVYFVLGNEVLVNLGFRNDWSTYYVNQGLAFCQRIEHSQLCRFQGFLSGPNQMGAFLILYLGLTMQSKFANKFKIMFFIVGVISLILTFSRSAWIGFMLSSFLYVVFVNQSQIKRYWKIIGSSVLVGLVAVYIFAFDMIRAVVIRVDSNSEHVRLWKEGLEFWLNSFWLGNGMGSVGPASRYFSTELIPESWFLQVAGQYGLIGLMAFIGFYAVCTQELFKKHIVFLGLVWLALLVPLNLLHSFESASLVYSLGLFTGLSLMVRQKNQL